MTKEEQLFAYKELRNNGQAFYVNTYEDADRIIDALEDKGYQQGREDAIDEFVYICRQSAIVCNDGAYMCLMGDVERIAGQLKEQKNE